MRVYIAGPYTKGDVAVNVNKVLEAADVLMDVGHAPYLPHLTHFMHLFRPRPYQDWLRLDDAFLPFCEALLRLPGESAGADREVATAMRLEIPVYYEISALLNQSR